MTYNNNNSGGINFFKNNYYYKKIGHSGNCPFNGNRGNIRNVTDGKCYMHTYNFDTPNKPIPNINAFSGNRTYSLATSCKMYKPVFIEMSDIKNKSVANIDAPSSDKSWNLLPMRYKTNKYVCNIYRPVSSPPCNTTTCSMEEDNESFYKIDVDKCRKIIIFDLDDTLIPTSYIQSHLLSKCYLSHKQALQAVKAGFATNAEFDFEIILCSLLKFAKYLSYTVVIVTNARSNKWIRTVKFVFPKFANTIQQFNIPIVRTDQIGEPSPIRLRDHFHFWMNAKKKKFNEIVQSHLYTYGQHTTEKIDFISIGDSEFEEVAAYELFEDNKHILNRSFNIKCESGLLLNDFVHQLFLIRVALNRIANNNITYRCVSLNASVQINMYS